MQQISRRQFLLASIAGCGTLFLPRLAMGALRPLLEAEPHFFLFISLPGGADQSYLFDARPLAMARAGLMQNFLEEEPTPFTGTNGGSTLTTALAAPLMPFLPDFSVLNGVLMATSFDGHDQNFNYLLTGSPFGGESFLPHLNQFSAQAPLPLDGLSRSFGFSGISNESGTVILDPNSAGTLKESLKKLPDISANTELGSFLASRFAGTASGPGRFSRGSRAMLDGFGKAPDLKSRLLNLESPRTDDPPELQFVTLLAGAFRNSVARTASLSLSENFDTHGYDQAKDQPKTFAAVGAKLAGIFSALKNTPFDERRSILDVTTVLVGTEFGRTMRVDGFPLDKIGTNHNPLTNTFLLGGKGIKGGMVVGASDFASVGESLSKAHLQLDATKEKTMGLPFDFERMIPRSDSPESFAVSDYLTANSLVNTIYGLFGVEESHYRTFDRNGSKAPSLRGLLK